MKILFTRDEVRALLRKHGLEVRKIVNNRKDKPSMLLAQALNEEMRRRSEEAAQQIYEEILRAP
jgi:hypothetical protein